MSVLLDTGPLVAIVKPGDEHHAACVEQLKLISGPLYTCLPVLTEAAWLLRDDRVAIQKVFAGFEAGLFELVHLTGQELPAVYGLMRRYSSIHLQFADAVIAYLAGRERIRRVFTLDRRDFSVVRYPGNKPFILLPQ